MVQNTHAQAMNAYRSVDVFGGASYADPHRLITMLMDGAMSRLSLAKGAMLRGRQAEKGELIGHAITIVGGLQGCLDMDKGDALSVNLNDLYDYMARRMLAANVEDDPAAIDEVLSLLREIKSAWEAIPQSVRDEHSRGRGTDGGPA